MTEFHSRLNHNGETPEEFRRRIYGGEPPPTPAPPVDWDAEMNPTTDLDREPAKPTAQATRSRKRTKNASGRFAVLNAFVDAGMAELSRIEIAAWFCLFRDTQKNGTAKVAHAYVAERCGCSRESVTRALTRLEKKGLVKTIRQGGLNRGLCIYKINGPP